ncbi:uncharacterized protein PAE49_004484 isoform 2-T3 [Odontesthes bonariensis]|uniref:uncharacterized protein LOC142378917 isoform X2 n=1 Tax=Odontesthes bonariensis TaxID=219752 RepID=UPI003F583669
MVRECIFPHCGNKMRRNRGLSFHRLPLRHGDNEKLRMWMLVLHLDMNTSLDTLRSRDYRVCSEHFVEDDFTSSSGSHRFLKRNAIPNAKSLGDNAMRSGEFPTVSGPELAACPQSTPMKATHGPRTSGISNFQDSLTLLLTSPEHSTTQTRRSLSGMYLARPPSCKQTVELQKKNATCQRLPRQEEQTRSTQSENKENRVQADEDEEFNTSLSVGDGHYMVDLRSSSELIVDEECILELFKKCRKCNRQCTVRKNVTGLKLVVNQTCCFCQHHFRWTNLPDEDYDKDDSDSQINGQNVAMSPSSNTS